MKPEDLGYKKEFDDFRDESLGKGFSIARVISEHKDRYVVMSEKGEYDSELVGSLLYSAESRYDYPAVGDWVSVSVYDDSKALIHSIMVRYSIIEREAVGKYGQKQIIATNIDYGLIVQAVDNNFNINRLERYLTICFDSKVEPLIILSKIDLLEGEELNSIEELIKARIKNIPIILISNNDKRGYDKLSEHMQKGKTYCMLGSSGVGKSTLVNSLSGSDLMKTGHISSSVGKGRHITSHRELIILEDIGIFIDNPGMRELGIADSDEGLEITFDKIIELSENCKFNDCTHTNEKDCAILNAIDNGDLDQGLYNNYQKLLKEKEHYDSTVLERRQKDKEFGKMIKEHKKIRSRNKF